MKMTREDLKDYQALSLDEKIALTQNNIRAWYRHWNGQIYVSFSGGKDSTVLLHLVRDMYPDAKAVFADTGLEYPEIRQFVKSYDNVDTVYPAEYNRKKQEYERVNFKQIITEWGYPIIGKEVSDSIYGARRGQKSRTNKMNGLDVGSMLDLRKYLPLLEAPFRISAHCCSVMKKNPMKRYSKQTGKVSLTAEMAAESLLRTQQWLDHGCNGFELKKPKSTPMAFWTEQDILHFIKRENIPISSVYGDIEYKDQPEQMRMEEYVGCSIDKAAEGLCTTGCHRTGCIFCAYGAHREKGEGRFQRLAHTHPRQYEYCIKGGEWVNGQWQPNNKGLGMGFVFDYINDIYGKDFIRYE